jgi:hypothetical protein
LSAQTVCPGNTTCADETRCKDLTTFSCSNKGEVICTDGALKGLCQWQIFRKVSMSR